MPLISHPIGVRSTVRALVKVLRIEGLCEAAWFAGNRQFVTMADHHHDDRLAIWYAAPRGAQEALLQVAPGRFFRPPTSATGAGSASTWTSRTSTASR